MVAVDSRRHRDAHADALCPKAAWLSRYAFAFIVGVGAGLAIPRTISSFILKQIEDTVRPLFGYRARWRRHLRLFAAQPGESFERHHHPDRRRLRAVLFFFSVEHSGPGKTVARAGILFLMISFGAAFGYTVMARMSLLIGSADRPGLNSPTPLYGRPTLWLVL